MTKRNKIILVKLLLLASFVFLGFLAKQQKPQDLQVNMLDIGQGDSILVSTPNQFQLLVDGGPGDQVLDELRKVMPFGDSSIDWVLLTHPDADHLQGLVNVIDSYQVTKILQPKIVKDNQLIRRWNETIEKNHIEVITIDQPQKIILDHGIVMSILHPNQDEQWYEDANDSSIVFRLDYGETSLLFTGDMEEKVEQYLVETYPQELDVDILKVAHHGSQTSSTPEFLDAVTPELALISVGLNNKFDHPSGRVLYRLNERSVPIWRTDESGIITVDSNGQGYEVFSASEWSFSALLEKAWSML